MSIQELIKTQQTNINVKDLNMEFPEKRDRIFDDILTPEQIIKYMRDKFSNRDAVELEAAIILPNISEFKESTLIARLMVSRALKRKIIEDDMLLDSESIVVSTYVSRLAKAKLLSKDLYILRNTKNLKGIDIVNKKLKGIEIHFETELMPKVSENLNFLLSYKILAPNTNKISKALNLLNKRLPAYGKDMSQMMIYEGYNLLGGEYLRDTAFLKMLEPNQYSDFDFTQTTLYKWGTDLLNEGIDKPKGSENMIIRFQAYLRVLAAKEVKITDDGIKLTMPSLFSEVKEKKMPIERRF